MELSTPKQRRSAEVVYFIKGERSGLVKIGKAARPLKRLSALQTGSGETLQLIGVIRDRDPDVLEIRLHERFMHLRVRGEWFSGEAELLDFIARHASTLEHDDWARREAMLLRVSAMRVTPTSLVIDPAEFLEAKPEPPPIKGGRRAILAAYKAARGLNDAGHGT